MCEESRSGKSFTVRELMFGLREEFEYRECPRCGSLQISELPPHLDPYYPARYYSFSRAREPSRFRRLFKRIHYAQASGRKNSALGGLLVRFRQMHPSLQWLLPAKLEWERSILDIGCGSGALLLQLWAAGFSQLVGIDPNIPQDLHYRCGVTILKRDLSDYDRACDFAMLHHSLEHMANPLDALLRLHRILAPGGGVLIRTPVAGTYAWRTYGVHWYQIDAPRHVFVPSERGLRLLAGRAGFEIEKVLYDSSGLQCWLSEQYRRGIPLRDERSHFDNPQSTLFSAAEIEEFEQLALRLNRAGDGDQACFFLRWARSFPSCQ